MPAMEIDVFWAIIESARSSAARPSAGRPFDAILTDILAARPLQDILEFYARFDELHGALYRWDVWAAAYLIGGGCSDDSFIDFRAGLIAQGRHWYEKAAASPDSLADHPDVTGSDARDILFYEVVNYAALRAWERTTGSDAGFYSAFSQYLGPGQRRPRDDTDMGEDFDFDDPREMRRRLPRLSAVCLPGDARSARRLLAP